jgi:ribonuclease Z
VVTMTVLGASGPITTAESDTTCLALQSGDFSLMIDCTGNPIGKLQQAGIDAYQLDGVLLTHRHPDHTYGLPSLLQGLGLLIDRRGPRAAPLAIYGLADVLDHARSVIAAFELSRFLPADALEFHEIPASRNHPLVDRPDLTLWTTPVEHFVPTVGLKVRDKMTGGSITYSSDTSPCDALHDLAQGSTILIQQCNLAADQQIKFHTNSTEAGMVAREAQAQRLVLIHMPMFRYDVHQLVQEAQQTFSGPIEAARPFVSYTV